MQKKPLIFLITLFIVLTFILGVRYGQRVEQTNKAINYILSLTPTKNYPPAGGSPTQLPLKFDIYENKYCGVKFLYPSSITDITQSSMSAKLNRGEQSMMQINCEKQNDIILILNDQNIASQEIKLQKGSLKAKKKIGDNTEYYFFQTKNLYNYQPIYFMIEKNLYPLFDKSLEYFPPK